MKKKHFSHSGYDKIHASEIYRLVREILSNELWRILVGNHQKHSREAPLTTLMQVSPMVGLAVGAAIIYGLVRAMVGEGKLSKFF